MNHSDVVTSMHFLKMPDDIGQVPVLTDVLVASSTAGGTTLWLAWDERRVPVLDQVVEPRQRAAFAPMRQWRSK